MVMFDQMEDQLENQDDQIVDQIQIGGEDLPQLNVEELSTSAPSFIENSALVCGSQFKDASTCFTANFNAKSMFRESQLPTCFSCESSNFTFDSNKRSKALESLKKADGLQNQ